jgi:transposase
LAARHAACDILNPNSFNEEDLYQNLDWLESNQARIEDRLFRQLKKEGANLFLYDVTSSYLEGEKNELASFGYNRDGKKGKRQIVIGLLCDEEGKALSIEVFVGNTLDPKTFGSQIEKVALRFGGGEVTLVGDRGMIKSPQVKELEAHHFHYITAITKPQIETLLRGGVIQMTMFDQAVAEVIGDGVRYVFRRNPYRAQEIQKTRKEKYQAVESMVQKQNLYLKEHSLARVEVARRKIEKKGKQLKISTWLKIELEGRCFTVTQDKDILIETTKLDGCYVLKTDLTTPEVTKEIIHDRYKDLSLVEWAFRSSKTVQLEMRPIHVRLASRTRGHAFVVMLAYRMIQELSKRWSHLNKTVEEGIRELSALCVTEVKINGGTAYHQIPEASDSVQELLRAAKVKLPKILPSRGIIVSTKKKLQERRKSFSN